ncbi:hypothetical protein E3E31_05370 [Thermococcus sp. M39]|uniref:hypothetical protein n=1 Tax=unclassified Thermococcus TaxID=2627626 RepID=UPI001438DEE6|nr:MULTISPECIES: hypothetical protein [unclassified Thermococcus]NJE07955.1 hypothetical protein [Thermococcus sp. M39]NJE13653.1 hypothetical protein [Thermococcus sp. LS2]
MRKVGVDGRWLVFIPLFLYVIFGLSLLRNEPFLDTLAVIMIGIVCYAFAIKLKALAPFAIVLWYLLMAIAKYFVGTLTGRDLLVFAMGIAFWIPISLIIYSVNQPSKTNS